MPRLDDESVYFMVFNRNKRSVSLDLRNPQAQELLRRLIAEADIVVDAADSFAVTYMLSDVCFAMARPLVSASVIWRSPMSDKTASGGAEA